MMPVVTPITVAMIIEKIANSMVGGIFCSSKVETGTPEAIDTPRLPLTKLPKKARYCCQSGCIKPHSARIRSS